MKYSSSEVASTSNANTRYIHSLPESNIWLSPGSLSSWSSTNQGASGHVEYYNYIRMNSHICHWSPSFRVAIDWKRKGIDRQPEAKKNLDTHPGVIIKAWFRRRHSWILRGSIHVHSETEKKIYKKGCISLPANVLESVSPVKIAISWDQSPQNWHRRPCIIGTNPQGWIIRWFYGDVTIRIRCNVPLWKKLLFEHSNNWRMLVHLRE